MNTARREKFKSLLLLLLLISSIVLILVRFQVFEYFVFQNRSPYAFALSLEEGLQNTLKPTQIIIRFGGGNNTKVLSNKLRYYQESKVVLKQALQNGIKLETIGPEEMDRARSLKALQLNFSSLNGKLLSRSFFLEKSLVDDIDGIEQILIPLVDEKGIFLMTENGLYKMTTREVASLPMVDALERSNYVRYYSLNSILDTMSPVLVPIDTANLNFKEYDTISGIMDERSDDMAKGIFGKKYDFTARILEVDGSKIYTYNYGQEVLKVQPDGQISYLNEDTDAKNASMEESVLAALDFLMLTGVDLNNLVLTSVESTLVNGTQGYSVRFSQVMDDLRILHAKESQELSLLTRGGKVYSVVGMMRTALPYDLSRDTEIMSPIDVLGPAYKTVLQSRFAVADVTELMDKITEVELVYYMNSDLSLVPCWRFRIEDKDYLLNAYTGDIEYYGLV